MDKLSEYIHKLKIIHSTKQIKEPFKEKNIVIRTYSGNGTNYTHRFFEGENLRKFNNFNLKYCSNLIAEYVSSDDTVIFELREFPNSEEK